MKAHCGEQNTMRNTRIFDSEGQPSRKGMTLIELGVPVSHLQDLPQLATARRCKSMYNSEQVSSIRNLAHDG